MRVDRATAPGRIDDRAAGLIDDSAQGRIDDRAGQWWRPRMPWAPADDPVTDLIRAHRRIHSRGDGRLLRRSYLTAERMHRGQIRKSGEDYITHPVAVARILADLGMDTTTLVAALLHDTVEDTSYTLPALEAEFGSEVALLVDGVTKLDRAFFGETAEVETIRKMLVKAGQDVRVLVIKLADRLHNMRTLEVRSPASRVRIANATLDVLVPLCDRLGIQALKRSLEDTVLAALEPEAYADIDAHVHSRPYWTQMLDIAIERVRQSLGASHIDAYVSARPRHYYSIWRDTIAIGQPLHHDLPRIAVVVDGKRTDCYTALGALHAMWRPVPGRFKDFIASPKNNLYRSLHTTVIGPDQHPIEVLIRTTEMHHAAEFGIVANFRDPLVASRLDPQTRAEQLGWLRRVLDWQHTVDDAQKFLDALRCDLSYGQIQVFTPGGKAVLLPAEATPVDLAYTLDSEIGNSCVGAILNGRLVPLSSRLSDGDVVEILTRDPGQSAADLASSGHVGSGQVGSGPHGSSQHSSSQHSSGPHSSGPHSSGPHSSGPHGSSQHGSSQRLGPAREWLDFVKSPQARLEINRWFQNRDEASASIAQRVKLGRVAIGLALRQEGRSLASEGPLRELASKLAYPDLGALLVAVADHRFSAHELVSQLVALVDRNDSPLIRQDSPHG